MRSLILTFLIVFTFANCKTAQTQQNSANISQPTPSQANVQSNNYEAGYARFTTSDKQYLGCWKTVKEPEVVNYELLYFQLTDKAVQISKMRKSVAYTETESNPNKDYFVLRLESQDKSSQLQPFLSINMVSDDEMTIDTYPTKDLKIEQQDNYWALKREDCETVIKQLKK